MIQYSISERAHYQINAITIMTNTGFNRDFWPRFGMVTKPPGNY